MKIVFYSAILNHHFSNVVDELWEQTGHDCCYVELSHEPVLESKGVAVDRNKYPYLLRPYDSAEAYEKAMELARTAECCVFSFAESLPFQKERMRRGLLSFDMSERWLKRGILNMLSPNISKMWLAYQLGGWRDKPLYKLCMSAYAAGDQSRVGTYRGKCYKWGYFTKVEKTDVETSQDVSTPNIAPLMWCSRYLVLKHPELPVLLASKLKKKSCNFVIDMYGTGEYETATKKLVQRLEVEDLVRFHGEMPNDKILAAMKRHDIFLFTSDKNEGWGAVANESMSNGCVLVASDAMGSSPWLVEEGVTGLLFHSSGVRHSFGNPDLKALDSLCDKVEWLLNHPTEMRRMQRNSTRLMQEIWSPQVAAARLLILIDCLQKGEPTPFAEGPCSLA